MTLIALGLSVGSPAAYGLLVVLVGIPLLSIVVMAIDDWRNK